MSTGKQPQNTTHWQDTEGGGRMQLCENTLKEIFPHTDKQPQTVYTEKQVHAIIDQILQYPNCIMDAITNEHTDFDGSELFDIVKNETVKTENVLLHTPEELQALKAEWQREVDEEYKRRVSIILSEPNGQTRELMIQNLITPTT